MRARVRRSGSFRSVAMRISSSSSFEVKSADSTAMRDSGGAWT